MSGILILFQSYYHHKQNQTIVNEQIEEEIQTDLMNLFETF